MGTASSRGGATVERIGELYEHGFYRYVRVAEAITGDTERAHDAVQEAFARAIRGRGGYRARGSLEGWLWRTVVNAARNMRRDLPPAYLPLHELDDERVSHNGRPREDLRAAIAALPERQRLVLFLRYYADLDYERIGDALEVSSGTVGATLNQAHAALRRVLGGVPR